MDSVERLKYGVTFDFLRDSIEKRACMDKSYEAHIEDARELLGEIVKGLESILSPATGFHIREKGRGYQAGGENLTGILELHGYDTSNLSEQQVRGLAEYFKDKIQSLGELRENPNRVYENILKKQRLLNICESFKKLYDKNYQVLKCVENQFSEENA